MMKGDAAARSINPAQKTPDAIDIGFLELARTVHRAARRLRRS